MNNTTEDLIAEVEEQTSQWNQTLNELEKKFEGAEGDLHTTYMTTIDELRMALEQVKDRLVEARRVTGEARAEAVRLLKESYAAARDLFGIKLATMEHQDL